MKKTLNLLSVTALAIIIGLTACNKQVDQNPVPNNAQSSHTKNNVANREPDPFTITDEDVAQYPVLGTVSNTQALAANYNFDGVIGMRPRFSFRWDGCYRPLGVCIGGNPTPGPREPLLVVNGNANDGSIGSGDGYANIYVISNSKVLIFPDQNVAMGDNTVPVTGDIVFSAQDADAMGYNSFVIKAGRYMLHSNYDSDRMGHGYIIADCVAQ